VRHWGPGGWVSRPDQVAGEEPLEIRFAGTTLTTTMRTPGHDIELAHGLLHAEGVIADRSDVVTMRYCDGVDEQGRNTYNVLDVQPAATAQDPDTARRTLVTSSACGVCGTAAIDALARRSRYPLGPGPVLDPRLVPELPGRLRAVQRGFRSTGGLHAAALVTSTGELQTVREDVGRHNAVDKVIGAALLDGRLPLSDVALLVSSRASFELVQKAVLAGIGMLIAVSAPSSLAVELARSTGLTLVAFARADGFNCYSGEQRFAPATSAAGSDSGPHDVVLDRVDGQRGET
jgi:FdhD protein